MSKTDTFAGEIVATGEDEYSVVLSESIIKSMGLVLGDDVIVEITEGSIKIRKAVP